MTNPPTPEELTAWEERIARLKLKHPAKWQAAQNRWDWWAIDFDADDRVISVVTHDEDLARLVVEAAEHWPRCIARIRELEGEQEEVAARAKLPIGHLGPRGCRNCGRSQSDVALARIAQLFPADTWQCEHCGTEHTAW